MQSFHFIFDLAIILLTTKILGLITKRFHMPQVVGALMAGVLFGPSCLNLIRETDFIHATAEIGVIVLMFCAGMETDIKELKKSGKASFVIAMISRGEVALIVASKGSALGLMGPNVPANNDFAVNYETIEQMRK